MRRVPLLDSKASGNVVLHLLRYKFFGSSGLQELGARAQFSAADHASPAYHFGGLQAHYGSAQHLRGWEERRQAIAQTPTKPGGPTNLLARHGLECPTVTGAGTGTFKLEVYTEVQCGSYTSMDAYYGRNLDRDGAPTKAFEQRLFAWATLMSRPTEDRTIVGAGLNAQIDKKLLEPWKLTSNFTDLTIN